MKVLHSGNVASVVYNLCKGLRKTGIDADLIYKRNTDIVEGTKERQIHYTKSLFEDLILHGIDISSYDIFHLHYLQEYINLGISFKILLKRSDAARITHAHGSITAGSKKIVKRLKSAFVRCNSDILLYSTPNILKNIERFNQEKIYLPNPIDTKIFKPLNEDIYDNRILCWVKIEKVKGIEVIWETARSLPQYYFNIIEYSDYGEQNRYISTIPKNVNLIPKKSHEKIPELINRYPIVLGQFKLGILSVSELEAMSCGKPVIAYWNREYDTLYSEPCSVLSCKSSTDVVKTIQILVNGEVDAQNLGVKSREWVQEHHALSVVTDKLIDIYKRILEDRS